MSSGYQAEQARLRHERETPLRIEALLIEIRDLLRATRAERDARCAVLTAALEMTDECLEAWITAHPDEMETDDRVARECARLALSASAQQGEETPCMHP